MDAPNYDARAIQPDLSSEAVDLMVEELKLAYGRASHAAARVDPRDARIAALEAEIAQLKSAPYITRNIANVVWRQKMPPEPPSTGDSLAAAMRVNNLPDGYGRTK